MLWSNWKPHRKHIVCLVFRNRSGIPSMTDIMILDPGLQIAIEGKMTEYVCYKEKTIREWQKLGGTGILHVSAEETKRKLEQLGLL